MPGQTLRAVELLLLALVASVQATKCPDVTEGRMGVCCSGFCRCGHKLCTTVYPFILPFSQFALLEAIPHQSAAIRAPICLTLTFEVLAGSQHCLSQSCFCSTFLSAAMLCLSRPERATPVAATLMSAAVSCQLPLQPLLCCGHRRRRFSCSCSHSHIRWVATAQQPPLLRRRG